MTIPGHPEMEGVNRDGDAMRITVCAECGALSTILFLDRDRWFCTKCRNEGAAAPAQVPITRPGARR